MNQIFDILLEWNLVQLFKNWFQTEEPAFSGALVKRAIYGII